jgi:hypothetical protein
MLRGRAAVAEYDIGAVTYFLRKVLWSVPGFTVEAYRDRLAALHEQIPLDATYWLPYSSNQ